MVDENIIRFAYFALADELICVQELFPTIEIPIMPKTNKIGEKNVENEYDFYELYIPFRRQRFRLTHNEKFIFNKNLIHYGIYTNIPIKAFNDAEKTYINEIAKKRIIKYMLKKSYEK